MAKNKYRDSADDAGDQPRPQTSMGEVPADPGADQASVEGGDVKGTADPYPPPTSDQAGERTANVPPAKKLPPDAPAGNVDELTRYKAEHAALKSVVANLGGNPDEVCKAASAKLGAPEGGDAPEAEGEDWRVTLAGHPTETVKARDEAGARAAYCAKHGIWAPATAPTAVKASEAAAAGSETTEGSGR